MMETSSENNNNNSGGGSSSDGDGEGEGFQYSLSDLIVAWELSTPQSAQLTSSPPFTAGRMSKPWVQQLFPHQLWWVYLAIPNRSVLTW